MSRTNPCADCEREKERLRETIARQQAEIEHLRAALDLATSGRHITKQEAVQ